MKNYTLVTLNWLFLVFAVLCGVIGAAAAFLGLAFFVSNTSLLFIAAVFTCVLASSGLARISAAKIARHHKWRFSLITGSGTAFLVAITSVLTVFRPFVPVLETGADVLPSDVKFWELSTGSRIAYTTIPSPCRTHDEPIIFVHGGPGARIAADENITDLSLPLAQEGYDVYLYDQIGGGYSDRLPDIRDYTVARHVADLEAIRIQLGADRAILIGESWGARLIVQYISAYPDNVEKCVIISPAPLYPNEWKNGSAGSAADRLSKQMKEEADNIINHRIITAMLLLRINSEAACNFIPEAEIDAFADAFYSLLFEGAVCDPVHLPKRDQNKLSLWAGRMTWMDLKRQSANLNESFASIDIPALIFRGECDYAEWNVTYQYKTLFPNSVLLFVEDAGHMLLLEQPDIFVDAVRAFLSDEPLPLPPYTRSVPPENEKDI